MLGTYTSSSLDMFIRHWYRPGRCPVGGYGLIIRSDCNLAELSLGLVVYVGEIQMSVQHMPPSVGCWKVGQMGD